MVNLWTIRNIGDAAIFDGLLATLRAAGKVHVIVGSPTSLREDKARLDIGADEVTPMAMDPHAAPSWVRSRYLLLASWVAIRLVTLLVRRALGRPNVALKAYRDADLVVSCGGGYLGGSRPGNNLIHLSNIAFARLYRRPCMVAPVSVEPATPLVGWMLSRLLRGTTVFARDADSAALLRELGLQVWTSPDLALRSPAVLDALQNPRPAPDDYVIGWAPRQFAPQHHAFATATELEDAAITALSDAVRSRGARVLLIPHTSAWGAEDDLALVRRLRLRFPPDVGAAISTLEQARDLREGISRYGAASVVFAWRLHAALLAIAAGRPVLVLGYEAKVRGMMRTISLDDLVIDVDRPLDGPRLLAKLAEVASSQSTERIRQSMLGATGPSEFDRALDRLLN